MAVPLTALVAMSLFAAGERHAVRTAPTGLYIARR